nr:MAG TPA: hypothetical protein [Caudoviricetes sp.]
MLQSFLITLYSPCNLVNKAILFLCCPLNIPRFCSSLKIACLLNLTYLKSPQIFERLLFSQRLYLDNFYQFILIL